MRRPRDWFRQAELDYGAACNFGQYGRYEWACFVAQQGAAKAVKALHETRSPDAS